MMVDLFEHDKFLFIAFEQGAGGHRLGRNLANDNDDVYWYSCKENGIVPLDTSINEYSISRRLVAPNHFDRMIDGKMLPPLFNVIEPYYNDIDEYYPLFEKLFEARGGLEIMESGKYIMYPVHVTKSKIKATFPNARIEEIIPNDINVVVEHYLKTTANFPAYLNLSDFRPNYLTSHAKRLEENKDAVMRDLFEGTDEEYKMYVYETLKNLIEIRKND
ncbi:MAG: hypothetical protein MKZ97_01520 [Alphaproteobacteria bacterium]|nr:hypothetical protein [Alphaproteobacteria bacterium]